MHMFRHNHSSMQSKTVVIPFQAAFENRVTSFGGKRLSIVFAESDKESLVEFLIMGQHPTIVVHSSKRYALGMYVLEWRGLAWLVWHDVCSSAGVPRTFPSTSLRAGFVQGLSILHLFGRNCL